MNQFANEPKKQEVVEFLLRGGYAVNEDGRIVSDGLIIPYKRIENKIDVDRRTVRETALAIQNDDRLGGIFKNLSSVPFLNEAAPVLDLAVIVIDVKDPDEVGILAEMAAVFSEHEVAIRQGIAEDSNFSDNPQFQVIIDSKDISEDVIGGVTEDLLKLPFVTSVNIKAK